ncbi:hypothetical protein KI387_027150, partial [Taxus chinensis]
STLGYLDPQYFQSVQLTEKSDVYSFGVVLVELLTGLKPVSFQRMRYQSNLAIYFLETIKSKTLLEILDRRLYIEEPTSKESMGKMANLAKECLSVEGERRSTMKEVVQELLWIREGTRPRAWLDNGVVQNQEEMAGLMEDVDEMGDLYPPLSFNTESFSFPDQLNWGVCVMLGTVILGGGVMGLILKRRKFMLAKEDNFRRNRGTHLQRLISSRIDGMRIFSVDEIEKASDKFSESFVLGAGG